MPKGSQEARHAAADDEQNNLEFAHVESIIDSMSSEVAQMSHSQSQQNQIIAADI